MKHGDFYETDELCSGDTGVCGLYFLWLAGDLPDLPKLTSRKRHLRTGRWHGIETRFASTAGQRPVSAIVFIHGGGWYGVQAYEDKSRRRHERLYGNHQPPADEV
jgi:hypothetical protein